MPAAPSVRLRVAEAESLLGNDAITTWLVVGIGSATNYIGHLGKISGGRYRSAAGAATEDTDHKGRLLRNFARFNVTIVVGAGLCGAAMTFSSDAAAVPPPLGGPTCLEQMAGTAFPVDGAAPAPLALPGPPVAGGPPIPLGAPAPLVPAGAGAPVAAPGAAPIETMAGPVPRTGKGVPSAPAMPASAPVVLPGPLPAPTEPPAVLVGAVAPDTRTACPGAR